MRKQEERNAAINLQPKGKKKKDWRNGNKSTDNALRAGKKINCYHIFSDSDLVEINSVKVNNTCMSSTVADCQFYYQSLK